MKARGPCGEDTGTSASSPLVERGGDDGGNG